LFGYTDQAIDPRTTAGDDPWLRTYEGILPGFTVRVRVAEDNGPWISWLVGRGHKRPTDPWDIFLPVGDDPARVSRAPARFGADETEAAFLTEEFIRWHGEQPAGRPWCAHLSYLSPHPPYVVPEPYASLYPDDAGPAFQRRASAREERARPRFIYPQAVADPPSALVLAEAEQTRLLERLPGLLDPVRAEGAGTLGEAQGGAVLEERISQFLVALLRRELAPEALREAMRLRERLGLIITLRETLSEFVAALAEVTPLPPALAAMVEGLHLLMEEVQAMRDAEAAAWVARIAADRGEMMHRLRSGAAGTADESLFLLTGLFERAVWLARRLALLEAERV
jgi:hypothetical protein